MKDLLDQLSRLPRERQELVLRKMREQAGKPSAVAAPPVPPALPRAPRDRPLPLSFAQQRLWFLDRLEEKSGIYNVPIQLRLAGPLRRGVLARALAEIVRRHETLRTTFHAVDGVPAQVAGTAGQPVPSHVDLRGLAPEARAAEVRRIAVREAVRPFDLGRGPLLRLALLELDAEEHLLLATVHHIVADGWSVSVFLREIVTLYAAFAQGAGSPLPELPIQYADFALWQRRWMTGERLEKQLAYWRRRLAGAPPLALPVDRPHPPVQTFRGRMETFLIETGLTGRLRELSQSEGATPFMVLLAAFAALLVRTTGQRDVVLGSPIANRTRGETEPLIGFFANTLALRLDLDGDPPFHELLERTRHVALGAFGHQDLPFELLVEHLRPERSLSRNPLVQALFVLQSSAVLRSDMAGIRLGMEHFEVEEVRFDLELHLLELGGAVRGFLLYKAELFDRSTVTRLIEQFQELLGAVTAAPARPLSELHLGGEAAIRWRLAGLPVALEEMAAVLRQEPSVADCTVLARSAGDAGLRPVAYVVPAAAGCRPEALATHLRARLPDAPLPWAFVPVSALPFTPAGAVDEAALARLEVVDEELVRHWERELSTAPGVGEVAVVIRDRAVAPPPLHLADLLPDWSGWRGTPPSAPGPAEPPARIPEEEQDEETAAPPAFADGGPLIVDAAAPRTLGEALVRAAADHPESGVLYVRADGSELFESYARLLEAALRVLAGLTAAGLRPGDAVLLQIDDARDHLAAFWGCVLGGMTPAALALAPVWHESHPAATRLRQVWELLERPPVLAGHALLRPLAALGGALPLPGLRLLAVEDLLAASPPAEPRIPTEPDEVAFLQLTSGSTGGPKCVRMTHRAVLSHVEAARQVQGYGPDDVCLNWLGLDHVVPILAFHLRGVIVGNSQVQVAASLVLADPLRWLDLLERHRVTHTWAPNFAYQLVAGHFARTPVRRRDLSRVVSFLNAGEQVTVEVARDFLAALAPFGVSGHTLHPAFGMAESATWVTCRMGFSPDTAVHRFERDSLHGRLAPARSDGAAGVSFVDLGPPIPGVQLRITDREDRPLSEGRIGRLQIRGPGVTPGYLRDLAADARLFTGDGWIRTGDLGFLLDGSLTVTGREKEEIVIHGRHLPCHEIEGVVLGIDGVAAGCAAAVAVLDPDAGGEKLALFFSPEEGVVGEGAGLIRALRARVAEGFGVAPVCVVPLAREEFPRTPSGKVQRTRLRDQLAAGVFDALLAEADIQLGNANTLPAWFHDRVWRRRDAAAALEAGEGVTLVLCDRLGLGDRLCRQLAEAGGTAAAVEPGDPGGWMSRLESLKAQGLHPDHVLHLSTWGEAAGEADPAAGLLGLLQALARAPRPVRLTVVASGSQAVTPADPLRCEAATVLGLLAVARQELPWLTCRHIDLPVDRPDAVAPLLWSELRTAADEPEVAFRGDRRLVPRLAPVNPTDEELRPLPWRQGGFYVLSGGLGGIGRRLAAHLLERYQARLLLVGRRPPDAPEVEEALADLRRCGGDLVYRLVDVADASVLRREAHLCRARRGAEIDGVIHLAGTYRERPLAEETPESWAAALRAKIEGARALATLLINRPDALFLAFSSVSAWWGGAGAGAYAAANRWLDHFVHELRREGRVQSHAIAWSLWDGVGLGRDLPFDELVGTQGFHRIAAGQGLHSLAFGLRLDRPRLLVGLDEAHPRIRPEILRTVPLLRLAAFFTCAVPGRSGVRLPELRLDDAFGTRSACDLIEIPAMPRTAQGEIDREALAIAGGLPRRAAPVPPRTPVETRMAALWRDLLGVTRVGVHDGFFELGGHSLLANQLMARIEEAFGVSLPVRRLFERPTLAALSSEVETALARGESEAGGAGPGAQEREVRVHPSLPPLPEPEAADANIATGWTGDLPVEALLHTMACEVLGLERIDAGRSLLELGVQSLQLTALASRIRDVFRVELPLQELFLSPTLATLARVLRAALPAGAGGEIPRVSLPACLVPLDLRGEGPPFFAVPPVAGSPLVYLDLARAMGGERPVYGFQSPGLLDREPLLRHGREMALRYLEAMRAVQPVGPYHLGGWSFGGIIAYEMARLLEQSGEAVALLALLDPAPIAPRRAAAARLLEAPVMAWAVVAGLARLKPPTSYAELRRWGRWVGLGLPESPRALWRRDPVVKRHLLRPLLIQGLRSVRVSLTSLAAMRRYEPGPFRGPIVLFRTNRRGHGDDPIRSGLERAGAADIEVRPAAGNHMTMMLDSTHATVLGERLAESLRLARTEPIRSDSGPGGGRSARLPPGRPTGAPG